MATDPHLITGIQAGRLPDNKLPVRMEFDDWWFSKDLNHINQRTLFVYALDNWQKKGLKQQGDASKEPDDLSYFGIASIHGLPLTAWPEGADAKTGWYCAHHKKTFATWHTPYLALYEQTLYREMSALIPEKFDDDQQAEYQHAADSWRLPFWDWAMKKPTWDPSLPEEKQYDQPYNGPNVPFAITQQKVEVRAGKGSVTPTALFDNPLFHYALNERTAFGDYGVKVDDRSWISKCRVTSRWPATTNDKDKKLFDDAYVNGEGQDYTNVTKALQGSVSRKTENGKWIYFANSLPEAVLRLMSKSKSGGPVMPYDTFVCNQWTPEEGITDFPSLEAIHDNMHGFTGGKGYMGYPGTAAFDPIFWLHHCNVDRLLSIWQELYPNAYKKWLDSDPDNEDPAGPNQNLIPFKDASSNFFTSATASYKHQELNYTYPELQRWNFSSDQEYILSIYKTFERLYSSSPKSSLLLKKNAPVAEAQMSAMTAKNLEVENFPAVLVERFPISNTNPERFGRPEFLEWSNEDYLLNVVYEIYALGGEPYSIDIYLGDVPPGAQSDGALVDFSSVQTAISTVYNFSSPAEARGFDPSGCNSCQELARDRKLASGQVILTDYLIERIVQGVSYQGLTLRNLDVEDVLAYLKANLHWTIQSRSGEIIPHDAPSMENLKFSVAHGPATHNSNPGILSQYGPYSNIWSFTATGADA